MRTGDHERRFWMKVRRADPAACWEWTGERTRHGYGRVYLYRRNTTPAHRFSWALANGQAVPPDLLVLHSCDNPPCVNPAHLRVGTHADNMKDKVDRRRLPCQDGEKNPLALLSDDDVIDIRTLRAMGAKGRALAKAFGVSEQCVCAIVKRRTWTHLP